MANKVLGITIDIEGKTSGLTKSLQEANSSINKTTSALKDVNKALELDPTNVELLAQKEELLNKQIEQTSTKLDVMKQVAEDANEALARGDISQEQYASLTAEIVKTEASLSGLEQEANGSADALEDVGDSAEDAGDQSEEASKEVEELGKAAEIAGKVAVAAFEAIVVAVAAVSAAMVTAAVETGKYLVNTTMETSHLADELDTLSKTTGLSTDTLQELNYAAELLDVDTSTVTGSITKLTKTMSSAADGSEATAKKFADLGVAYLDANGEMRNSEDVFWDAIDALGQMTNETERDAAAMELFGKSAKELNPLIEAGSGAFAELAAEAHEVGYVMDSETIEAFGDLDDNMQRLSNGAQAVEQSFGQVLLPLLTDISGEAVDLLGDFSGALSETGGDIDKIGELIEQFAPRAVTMVEKYVPKILGIVEQTLNALLPVVISVAPQLITMVGSLLETVANSISQNAESFISAFSMLFGSVVDSAITLLPVLVPLAIELILTLVRALTTNAPLLLDGALSIIMSLVENLLSPESVEQLILGATAIVTGLLRGLTEALPLLIPAALNAILTIVDTLLSSGCLSQILSAALTLIVTLATALIDYLPQLIARLPEIIMGIVEFLIGDGLPLIIQAGFQLITGIVGSLPEIIVAIIDALISLVGAMFDYITGDGAEDILKGFEAAFDGIIEGAKGWGSDLLGNFISGITSMFGKLKDTVSSAAQTVADYLHFSEPKYGPLSDFNESGGDMVKNFIASMESETTDLENALYDTAGTIATGWGGSLALSARAMTAPANDYQSGLSRIEQAITANVSGTESGTWVFPIYIGSDHVDTLVVDAIDRYNYATGGH